MLEDTLKCINDGRRGRSFLNIYLKPEGRESSPHTERMSSECPCHARLVGKYGPELVPCDSGGRRCVSDRVSPHL